MSRLERVVAADVDLGTLRGCGRALVLWAVLVRMNNEGRFFQLVICIGSDYSSFFPVLDRLPRNNTVYLLTEQGYQGLESFFFFLLFRFQVLSSAESVLSFFFRR